MTKWLLNAMNLHAAEKKPLVLGSSPPPKSMHKACTELLVFHLAMRGGPPKVKGLGFEVCRFRVHDVGCMGLR